MLANVDRIEEILEKYSIDAIIASTPENVTYLSDFRSYMQQYARVPIHVIWPRERSLEPAIVLPIGESRELVINKLGWIKDIRPYGSFSIASGQEKRLEGIEIEFRKHLASTRPPEAVDALVSTLRDKELDRATIALDEMWISTDFKCKIEKALPECRILNGYEILREIRMVKTSEEVRRLRRAAEIAEKGAIAIMSIARPGVTGTQLAREYNRYVIENSALPLAPSIAIGKFSYLQNIQQPTTSRLKKRDLIRMDPGCLYQCYFSDVARTAVVGEPTNKQRTYYSALLAGELAAIESVRAGSKVSDILEVAIKSVRRNGISDYDRHHIGHGIGIEFYDDPKIESGSNLTLLDGMVINIELAHYELGFGGLHVEDTILVKHKGHEFLSTSDREMWICDR